MATLTKRAGNPGHSGVLYMKNFMRLLLDALQHLMPWPMNLVWWVPRPKALSTIFWRNTASLPFSPVWVLNTATANWECRGGVPWQQQAPLGFLCLPIN